jgi:hypothetical protein
VKFQHLGKIIPNWSEVKIHVDTFCQIYNIIRRYIFMGNIFSPILCLAQCRFLKIFWTFFQNISWHTDPIHGQGKFS